MKLLNFSSLSSICLWFLPDVSMFIVNMIVFIVLRKISAVEVNTNIEETEPSQNQPESEICDENTYTPEQYVILKQTGINMRISDPLLGIFEFHLFISLVISAIICSMTTILLAAYLQPSVPGAIYFIVFLLTATVWASFKEIDRAFAIICLFLCVLLVVHISALVVYQTPWPQQYLDTNNTFIRYV